VTGTGEWAPGPILDNVGLLGVRVGAWNHFGHPAPEDGRAPIPPLGERNTNAIKAGHGAIEVIDEIIRDLQVLRGHLVTELRADEDERAKRVDATLAEARARREVEPRPGWLYGQGCCERWTPEDGCPLHTGRSAMPLRARELDRRARREAEQ
jgi:hypothetical protein